LTMSSLSSDNNSTGGLVSVGAADLILDQNIDTVYAGRLMSNTRGTLHKSGPGTLMLTGDNAGFQGKTTISDGTLLVGDANGNGTLGWELTVASGGVLGGSGVVGKTTIESGGTLA